MAKTKVDGLVVAMFWREVVRTQSDGCCISIAEACYLAGISPSTWYRNQGRRTARWERAMDLRHNILQGDWAAAQRWAWSLQLHGDQTANREAIMRVMENGGLAK
jgi:hypothetical protein